MALQTKLLGEVLVAEPGYERISAENYQAMDEIRCLFQTALDCSARALLINLNCVDYVDSPGLGAFISGHMSLRGKCSIHLCCVRESLEKTLVHTRMNLLFPVHASVKEALAAIGKKSG